MNNHLTPRNKQQEEIPMIAIHEPTQDQWSEMSVFITELAKDIHAGGRSVDILYYLNNAPYTRGQLIECAALLIDSVIDQEGSPWTPPLMRQFIDEVPQPEMADMLRVVLADYPDRLLLIDEAMDLRGAFMMILVAASTLCTVVVALGEPGEVLEGLSGALINSLI
jgi:hypothetical protein